MRGRIFPSGHPRPCEQIRTPSVNEIVYLYGCRAACAELRNRWVCFLEETPTLFLSCAFLNSVRTFPGLASGVSHFLTAFPCQGAFLSLPRKCFSQAPTWLLTSFNSPLKEHLLTENVPHHPPTKLSSLTRDPPHPLHWKAES